MVEGAKAHMSNIAIMRFQWDISLAKIWDYLGCGIHVQDFRAPKRWMLLFFSLWPNPDDPRYWMLKNSNRQAVVEISLPFLGGHMIFCCCLISPFFIVFSLLKATFGVG